MLTHSMVQVVVTTTLVVIGNGDVVVMMLVVVEDTKKIYTCNATAPLDRVKLARSESTDY